MNILDISFTKIHGEKHNVPKGNIKVANGINIANLEKSNMGVGGDRQPLTVEFTFKSQYKPDIADIELKGKVLFIETQEEAKKTLETWEENKNLGEQKTKNILNKIMDKCNLDILLLSRELSLPSPVKPMNFKSKKQE